jgi:hypothetical protein
MERISQKLILPVPKKFPAFYKTRNLIDIIISAPNWNLSSGSLLYSDINKKLCSLVKDWTEESQFAFRFSVLVVISIQCAIFTSSLTLPFSFL